MKLITKFKHLVLLLFLLILFIIFSAFSYTNAVFSNISDNVFRLHVIANSNSNEDQSLKYIVRDSILEYINEISKNANSKKEVMEIAEKNIDNINLIATNTIEQNGYNYNVKVSIGNFSFPTKTYGDITFPPGYYDALKIEIGEASGQNWWCVMFPPLCFVDVTSGVVSEDSKQTIQSNLSEEEYNLISENNNDINLKFKIVEMFQNISMKLAKS